MGHIPIDHGHRSKASNRLCWRWTQGSPKRPKWWRGSIWFSALVVLAACTSGGSGRHTEPGPAAVSGESDAERYTQVLADCLREGGATVEVTSAVSFSAEPEPGMEDGEVEALVAECRAKAGPLPERPTDPETAERVYPELLAMRDCLNDLGFSISQPPSLETFIEEFPVTHGSWHPYIGLERQFSSIAEQQEAERLCPPHVE